MDTTIRNLDERAYRELKARAALEGKSLGEALTEAIRAWVGSSGPLGRAGSLRDLRPQSWRVGSERLSEGVDSILYGERS